MFVIC